MSDGYPHMDNAAANKECRRRGAFKMADCPKCKMRVALHCDQCNIQVSGCLCTEVERFGESTAIQRLIEREGVEQARVKLKAAGFILPEGL